MNDQPARRLLFAICLLFLLNCRPVTASPVLRVEASESSQVYLGDSYRGSVPVSLSLLSPGSHRVSIRSTKTTRRRDYLVTIAVDPAKQPAELLLYCDFRGQPRDDEFITFTSGYRPPTRDGDYYSRRYRHYLRRPHRRRQDGRARSKPQSASSQRLPGVRRSFQSIMDHRRSFRRPINLR